MKSLNFYIGKSKHRKDMPIGLDLNKIRSLLGESQLSVFSGIYSFCSSGNVPPLLEMSNSVLSIKGKNRLEWKCNKEWCNNHIKDSALILCGRILALFCAEAVFSKPRTPAKSPCYMGWQGWILYTTSEGKWIPASERNGGNSNGHRTRK